MDPLPTTVSAIAIVRALAGTYKSINGVNGIPDAFGQVEKHLPLAERILRQTEEALWTRTLSEAERDSLGTIVADCQNSAEKLQTISSKVARKSEHAQDTKWTKRKAWYRDALRGREGYRVERLMNEILLNVEELTWHQAFASEPDRRQVQQEVRKALRELREAEPSIEDAEFESVSSDVHTQHVAEGGRGQQNNPRGGTNTFNSGEFIITGEHAQVNFATDEAYLRALFAVGQTNPTNDKRSIERRKGGLLADSYRWILSNDDFKRWQEDPSVKLLWIRGDPGKGKTMLLCGVIDELSEEIKRRRDKNQNLAYFFCLDERRDDSTSILRGLLMLLFSEQPALRHSYEKKFKGQPPLDVGSWDALEQLTRDVLRDDQLWETYIIVDALDECHEGLWDLLGLISETHPPRVKFLLSSRPSDRIQNALRAVPGSHILSLELNSDSITAAVTHCIRHVLRRFDPELRTTAERYLREKAENTFLWVALVARELAEDAVPSWEAESLLERLKAFPAGLDSMYQRMLDRILGDTHEIEEVNAETRRSLCPRILALVTAVQRPVSIDELELLIEWPAGFPNNDASRREAVGYCRSFLSVGQRDDLGMIHVVHQSAKDFLQRGPAAEVLFPSGLASYHRKIAVQSMWAMRVVFETGESQACLSERSMRLVAYPCLQWPNHLMFWVAEIVQKIDPDWGALKRETSLLCSFTKSNLLRWFECLATLQVVSKGIETMGELRRILHWTAYANRKTPLFGSENLSLKSVWSSIKTRSSPSDGILSLVRDAIVCLKAYGNVIERCPSQVHISMLMFSGSCNRVRKTCLGKSGSKTSKDVDTFGWVSLARTGGEILGTCTHTLETGHDSGSIILSPDGSHIVTILRSLDKIQIWSTMIGRCLTTLSARLADGQTGTPMFSPGGTWLAGVLQDGKTIIWNVMTGKIQLQLDTSFGIPESLAFFPDGDSIVLVLLGSPEPLLTYDVASGRQIKSTALSEKPSNGDVDSEGQIDVVTLPAKDLLAVVTSTPSVLLYELGTGRLRTRLPCTIKPCPVNLRAPRPSQHTTGHLMVSPDESCIAYVHPQNACAITVVDIDNGQSRDLHPSHSKMDVSISSVLAVKGYCLTWVETQPQTEGSIAVWNVKSKKRQRTLRAASREEMGAVVDVCAHPIYSLAMALCEDRRIHCWNLDTGQHWAYKGNTKVPSGIAFSAKGGVMTSTTPGGLVKVWDAIELFSKTDWYPMERHVVESHVTHVVLSPNGSFAGTRALVKESSEFVTLDTHRLEVWSTRSAKTAVMEHDTIVGDYDVEFCMSGKHPSCSTRFAISPHQKAVAVPSRRHGKEDVTVLQLANQSQLDEEISQGNLAAISGNHDPSVRGPHMQFSTDGKSLMVLQYDGSILKYGFDEEAATKIMSKTLRRCLKGTQRLEAPPLPPTATNERINACSLDLRYAAHAYCDGNDSGVIVRDTVSGGRRGVIFRVQNAHITSMALSPDGRRLACAFDDTVQVWNALSGKELVTLGAGGGLPIISTTFSHDANLVVSASVDNMIKAWDLSSGACMFKIASRHMADYFVNGELKSAIDISKLQAAVMSGRESPDLDPFFGLTRRLSRACVTRNGKELLWLPPAYQPYRWAVQDSIMVIFCVGDVQLFLRFSKDESEYPAEFRGSLPFRVEVGPDGVPEVVFGDAGGSRAENDHTPGFYGKFVANGHESYFEY